MISLSDTQLRTVMAAAKSLPVEQRSEFLKLVAEQLKIRDCDVSDAIERALRKLNHVTAA
jgi:hypothetical protein